LAEDCRCRLSRLVEKDAKAFDNAQMATPVFGGESNPAIVTFLDQMGGREAVSSFG
jgi:hypothetical protein